MGVDEAKPPQVSGAEPEKAKVRDKYTAAIPDKDVGNLSAAVKQEAKLTSDLPGQFRQAAGRFRRHDLLCAGFAPTETLYLLELPGLKAGSFSFYFCYGFLLAGNGNRNSSFPQGGSDSKFKVQNSKCVVSL